MENILEVFIRVAENEGIKITQLEKAIGASKGVLSRAIAKDSDIQSKWLLRLVENYPGYNLDWLLTGKGSMLREPAGPVPDSDPSEVRKQISRLLELLDQKDEEIIKLKKELQSKDAAEHKRMERKLGELKKKEG